MKSIYITLLIIAGSTLCSCENMTVSTGDGSAKVTGDGKMNSESRTMSAFNAIDVEGVFNVILDQGDKEAVRVEADENIIPLVLTDVDNNTLKVKLKDDVSIRNIGKVNVYITLKDIQQLTTKGVGSLKCRSTLHLKDLKFDCEGVGASSLDIVADHLGVTSAVVGALTLTGQARDVKIDHSGVGEIAAFGLKAEDLALTTSGVGAAEVYASATLNINASGIGNVAYKGGAPTKNIRAEGLGKVKEVN